jgi:hypothetical protein
MLGLATVLVVVPAAWAQQQNTPHAGYVYPAGGRQGTEFQVMVGGQFLNGVSEAFVSGAGVQATIVEYTRPITPMQANQLREKMRELTERRAAALRQQQPNRAGQGQPQGPPPAWTPEDEKTLANIRQQLLAFQRRQANPVLSETVTVSMKLAPDAAAGQRELRLATPAGLTNPLIFCVGQLPEFSKQAAVLSNQPIRAPAPLNRAQPKRDPEPPMDITLPAIVNGQMTPGGVDRYRFQAGKGQRLVVAASARELMPYISDAVPGWFQATLALYDANGTELDYADHFRFHPDPVLSYEIPSDGQYLLAIHDSIYRGRDDFVYRIAVGELPFVTSIFPLGGKAGAQTSVEVKGWNLPVAKVKESEKRSGIHPLSVRQGELLSNTVPFEVDTLPELAEKEPNNQPKNAQDVTPPIIVNGRLSEPGDWDVFRFKGRAGEEIVAEVFARRLDSPLDSVLKLTDSTGRQLAFNDDFQDKGAALLTHQADSQISAKLPANGTYYLHLGDGQQKGGPEYVYRLRISRPRPDFELRVVPSSLSIRGGLTVPITVYALRRDGFAGDIALTLKDAPAGFTLSGGGIPAGQDQVRLTLTAPPLAAPVTAPPGNTEMPFKLHLEGRATIGGGEVSRPAVPAEDMMQAFAYHHLVPREDWMVLVTRGGPARLPWKLATDVPMRLRAGGTVALRLSVLAPRYPASQLRLELAEPPEGLSIKDVSPSGNDLAILLSADADKAKPGLKGNLIVNIFNELPPNPTAPNRPAAQRRQPLGTLPAIPFEIVTP